jgi:hypothetical protein
VCNSKAGVQNNVCIWSNGKIFHNQNEKRCFTKVTPGVK